MKKILYISLVVHFIASVFSVGFHHFDEHFQILEFMNYSLGLSEVKDLPWEFQNKMRSWFQVYLYMGVYKTVSIFGISSPFIHVFVFRLLTSLLGVYGLYLLIPYIKETIKDKKYQNFTYALLNLSWFIPYIQTRPSAEGLGANLFLIGFAFFLRKDSLKHTLLSGLFLGAAYLCKYQIALMVMFLWFWGLFLKKKTIKELSVSAFAILFMIFAGIGIDFFGYGTWTFAPWNMLDVNLLQGKMKGFGEDAWYYFLEKSFKVGVPPLSLAFIASSLVFFVKFPKSPITWLSVPYILFHTIVSHKELRFLFPTMVFAPFMLGVILELYKDKYTWMTSKKLVKPLIYLNCIVLVAAMLRPANPAIKFYNFLYNAEEITEIKTNVEGPFSMVGLTINYYNPRKVITTAIDKNIDLMSLSNGFYFFNRGRFIFEMDKNSMCSPIYMTYPKWVLNFNIGNWISRSKVWSLYKCN